MSFPFEAIFLRGRGGLRLVDRLSRPGLTDQAQLSVNFLQLVPHVAAYSL
mgnify:CR=1 FL=1